MSRWSYLLAVVSEARSGPFVSAGLWLYGVIGFISLIKSELVERKSPWAEARLLDWIRPMSLQAWLILGLALTVGIGFEAAYRLHLRQSEAIERSRSAEARGLPPVRGQVMEILSEAAEPGKFGNLPYGLRVLVRPTAKIDALISPSGPAFSLTVYVNDKSASVSFELPDGIRQTGSSHNEIGGVGETRAVFAGRGLSPRDVVAVIVSSMGAVKVLRVEAG